MDLPLRQGAGDANKSFQKKALENDQFTSIWWSEGGKCIVINEIRAESIRNFIQQLNLYGFLKMQWVFQRSASLSEFFPEVAAPSPHNKVQQLLGISTN
ncbi:PREDICTED: heat shock transcription factor, Y-linked-like [Acanthisitta chloris]|uniref:heat shock transcription factor, Y-linked-like n=1 Tax=Acanthisitta chloris TaxID=57068 RepID=UPI0004F0C719|nr:PREDICTED: heat shock transcription factor, Y-linked-like [Acanthisitta chloris]